MAGKKHTTALGRPFDMAALAAQHEKVRAVGNMSVNARGDIIDSNNKVIVDVNKRVKEVYNSAVQKTPSVKPKIDLKETTQDELNDLDDDVPNPKKD